MFTKVLSVFAIAAGVSAQHHSASSYSSINSGSNQYAPTAYHSAPAYSAPAYHAPVPAYHASAPAYHDPAPAYHQEAYPDTHPQYNFKYGVEDVHTGDVHSQQEQRDGDIVQGEYSLVQPDGITRIVHYTADKNGFNAQVAYDGHAAHSQHAPAKIAVAAPAYNHYH